MTISRRGFTQAVGTAVGSLLLPSWRAFKQRKQIDLTPFCEEDIYGRYDMSKPFAQDGLAYATDAGIAVRTTLADLPELGDEVRLPPASALPWWDGEDTRWHKWPKQSLFGDGKERGCPFCWWRGVVGPATQCAKCRGEGDELCKADDDGAKWQDDLCFRPCRDCQGTGWQGTRCDYCGGVGSTTRPSMLRLGSIVIAGHYDQRIRNLGSDLEYTFKIYPDRRFKSGMPSAIVNFRGDGFEGLLMPLDMSQRGDA